MQAVVVVEVEMFVSFLKEWQLEPKSHPTYHLMHSVQAVEQVA